MIEIQGLTKTFGAQRAVDDLSFTAPSGLVTGFLGPNGSGKSTTLRMICGLARPDAGTATIDGERFTELAVPGRAVGVMLDAAAQHPGRTGGEVLRLAAMANGFTADVVAPMLERVGLTGAEGKRVRAYSLGMRQRLGIASALMGQPRVLILDEPVNGLDPAGIRWMRTLLDEFASEGGTVLLSSHLLGEVQAIADKIVVIHQGRLVVEGETQELYGTGDRYLVQATDPTVLASALDRAGLAGRPTPQGIEVTAPASQIGAVARDARLVLVRLEPIRGDLESLYLTLTEAA